MFSFPFFTSLRIRLSISLYFSLFSFLFLSIFHFFLFLSLFLSVSLHFYTCFNLSATSSRKKILKTWHAGNHRSIMSFNQYLFIDRIQQQVLTK